jgi:hypothetical protein
MALLRCDSFDHYNTATATAKGWTLQGATLGAFGRNSTNGLRAAHTALEDNYGVLGVSASGATAVIGFAFRETVSASSVTYAMAAILNGSTPHITVTVTTTRAIEVRRGGLAGTVLATSAGGAISTNTWHFIEIKVVLSDSVGTYEVRVDGVNKVSGTGADTVNGGSAVWTGIHLGSLWPGTADDYTWDFDDLYVCDGTGGVNDTFLGDHRIVCVVASSGNGTNADWSPSTGSDHGALVDENPATDTDYNQSGTAGHRDTYNFAAVGVAGTVKAVQTVNYIKADVAGVRYVGDVARIGGTNYDSTGTVVLSDWVFRCELHPTSPATATAWTVAEIDGAEFGVKVTA